MTEPLFSDDELDGLRDAAPMNKAAGGSKRKVGTNCPDLSGTPRTNAPQSELEERILEIIDVDHGGHMGFAGDYEVDAILALIHQESQKAVVEFAVGLKEPLCQVWHTGSAGVSGEIDAALKRWESGE